jgi:endoglycosylceramidase
MPRRHPRATIAAGIATLALVAVPGSVGAQRAAPVRPATPATVAAGFPATGPGLLGHDGRWLTDADGRVVLLHGVNLVAKGQETPAERGFDEDDAQWLQDHGFDAVRLGLSPDAFMPTPGVVDQAYLTSFAATAQMLTDHGLLVLIDLHQDGWGPVTSGNGFPAWMTFTHGAENTHTGFPLYYVTNPAIQAAFDSFWANEEASDGIGLQDHVATMFEALAGAVGANPNVLGYDILNEPWPGTNWNPCYQGNGCPEQDASGLDQLHAKVTDAIRSQDQDHLVFGEPYVLFNFGTAPTHIRLPGDDPRSGMSWHMYTTEPSFEPDVIANAIAWSEQTGGALLATEFDEAKTIDDIERMVGELDNALMPWMWWSYDGFVHNMTQPLTDANIDLDQRDALVRPHPVQVAGTPDALDFDEVERVLRFRYRTDAPSGPLPSGTETVIKVPELALPDGYEVKVTGGTVTSAEDAEVLTVVSDGSAGMVFVKLWPKGQAEPDDTFPPSPLDPPLPPIPTTTVPGGVTTTTAPTEGTEATGAMPVPGTSSYTG